MEQPLIETTVLPPSAALRDKEHSGDARFGARLQVPDPAGAARSLFVLSERVERILRGACFRAAAHVKLLRDAVVACRRERGLIHACPFG